MEAKLLSLYLFSSRPLRSSEYSGELYHILDRWTYRPSKFNDVEPLRNKWESRRRFIEICEANDKRYFGPLIVRWSKPSFNLMLTILYGPKSKNHSLSIFGCSSNAFDGETFPLALDLGDQIFEHLGFDYGFACVEAEYYHSNIHKDVQIDERTVQPVQVVGMEWPDCIPGLYWCNYFGKAYFEQGFGRRIADLPNTTKLANGIRLMRSDSALDWESPEDRERTQSLMDTLGRDWFFTKETGMPDKALKTDKSLFLKPLSQ
jgi:hypothetical protein